MLLRLTVSFLRNHLFLWNTFSTISLLCSDSLYRTHVNLELEKIYGKKDVFFLSEVAREDIPDILSNATLYLVGSLFEEFSISIIEAMAKGVPFVSTNVGNTRLLPGGIIVESISQMHKSIDLLLNNTELYKEYSRQGRAYAMQNCRTEYAVDQLEKYIQDLM